MRLLAFSDVHRDKKQAARLAEMSADADVVVGAGDFASMHLGLEKLIDMLVTIEKPAVLVPGNNETEDALRKACRGWASAVVLHGSGAEIDGVPFYGLGAGVPTTPWPWSFDLSEEEAAGMLAGCPEDAVLVVHSPPKGHLDGKRSLGSEAVLRTIEEHRPRVAICGHIHECAGERAQVGATPVLNVGPDGVFVEV
ncbi:MAG: metallophosphoesterase family protein [Thermoleophilaceae bacterium]